VKSSAIHKGEEMKRTLFIILSVVVVFFMIGITLARLYSEIGNTFSTISVDLPGSVVARHESYFEGPGKRKSLHQKRLLQLLILLTATAQGSLLRNGSSSRTPTWPL
jgi:hypothetical protein